MLFLFFGVGTKLKALGPGVVQTCPHCHNTAEWQRVERYRFASLFFVRLARWHRERLEACSVCGYARASEVRRERAQRSLPSTVG